MILHLHSSLRQNQSNNQRGRNPLIKNVIKIERKAEQYENVENSMTELIKPRSFM
jgi:hypothetical protein